MPAATRPRSLYLQRANRLISVTLGSASTQFSYDGLGNRLLKVVNSDTTTYTLDVVSGLPQVIVETTGSDSDLYLTGLAQFQNDAWVYQHPDGLGAVRHLSDASAEVTLLQSYDPFGNPVEQSGPGASGFGYTGEQEDANTGLVFLRARYYDPSVGRFVNRDPWMGNVMRPDTLQGYSYGRNNPILYTDPSGRDYVVNVDRYTCDDSHARGGYVQHVDKATGTWGFWPCIVNPANLPINATLQITPEGHLQYPVPARAAQQTPYQSMPAGPTYSYSQPPYLPLLFNDCPIPNPAPKEPVRVQLPFKVSATINAELVLFPPGADFVVEENKNEAVATFFAKLGLAADAVEAAALIPPLAGVKSPAIPEAAGGVDVLFTMLASGFSGESYFFEKPVASLPNMTVISQDIVVTSVDAAVPIAIQNLGVLGGPPGIVAGYVASERIDAVTTTASALYDSGRLEGKIPIYFGLAILWDLYPSIAVLIQAQGNW